MGVVARGVKPRSKKERHQRFLAAGFFPPEMPSCFYSDEFAQHRDFLWRSLSATAARRGNLPAVFNYVSSKATVNFPRFRREDRRHSYLNPISFFLLSKVLADHYINLRKLNRQSRLSVAPSIFDWGGSRALIPPGFSARDRQNSSLNARFEVLAEADINGFYHSIYTHAIPWAIHTKAVAKQRRDTSLYGNLIDQLVRNGQDGQTIGIPVGPDTSRLIAEVVGSAIDRAIQGTLRRNVRATSANERTAMRFVDDFTFGCASVQEAERVIAVVRRAVNSFELELNNSKTRPRATAPFLPSGWREHLQAFCPIERPYSAAALNRYFYNVELVARDNPETDVCKYAIKTAARVFMATDDWEAVQDYLLSSYRKSATVLPQVVEVIILRQLSRNDVPTTVLTDFVNSRLPVLVDLQKSGEIIWLLFLALALRLRLRPRAVEALLTVEDGAVALLAADARTQDVIPLATSFDLWNQSLTEDGLNGPMWLYAYESTIKDLNGIFDDRHLTDHPYFRYLAQRRVPFYRQGLDHLSTDAVLRAQRIENIRRRFQTQRLESDLGEEVDDFEPELGDEDEEEDIYS